VSFGASLLDRIVRVTAAGGKANARRRALREASLAKARADL